LPQSYQTKFAKNRSTSEDFMSVTDKLRGLSNHVQQTSQNAVIGLAHVSLRLASGFFIGFVLALVFQEVFELGTFMLVFLTTLFLALIYKVLASRTLFQIIVFDFICVLIGSLLRMYILMAPN
jgi:hypothetical protein